MESLYFAYGSNMSSHRLRGRISAVHAVGRAVLFDFAWHCNKRGRDGTGKANLVATPGAQVWGVLFALAEDSWHHLDRFEAGYRRIEVPVLCDGRWHHADTYLSEHWTEDPRPTPEYHGFLVAGAREHGLPEAWLARLEALAIKWAGEPEAAR